MTQAAKLTTSLPGAGLLKQTCVQHSTIIFFEDIYYNQSCNKGHIFFRKQTGNIFVKGEILGT